MDIKQLVAQNITRIRISSNLSQYELADILTMKQSAIARIERGKWNVTVETLARFALALKVPPADLLAYES